MNMSRLIRLLPTMEIIEEAFLLAGWNCSASITQADQVYRNVRLYTGNQPLLKDVIYTLRPGETDFPTDEYAYICSTPLEGKANHICCPDAKAELLLDFLLELYSRLQQQEMQIDQLGYGSANLQELCQLGETLLGNPVCIHDDWFIFIGISAGARRIMEPEHLMNSEKGFLPRMILDDFQHDSDFLETYSHTRAQIWDGNGISPSSLYVNLWDERIYRGRLLVIQSNRAFRKVDFLLAQILTQRAIFLLRRQLPDQHSALKSMDDIVFSLLVGKNSDRSEHSQLLRLLNWERTDQYVCACLRKQQPEENTVMEHILHSDLFQVFPGSYVLLTAQEQCLILNLTKSKLSYYVIAHKLAPLCRDYCLYAGFSSPVTGLQDWHLAYYQAGIALDQAFRLRSDKWIIPFSHCALDHLLHNISGPLQPWHIVAPQLRTLRSYDQEKGTQYFDTFREYLLQERDIPRTADALIIHRTTLLYRLKKIQSLIHIDLEDPRQRLYLALSLCIMDTETNQAI
ncbi:MAG: helix-turn-helix domain-containing protein [Oscillospiraceae bacterium]|nr:helix-turn-helix domain-containing protein [Oscillospiraceae bacterium]